MGGEELVCMYVCMYVSGWVGVCMEEEDELVLAGGCVRCGECGE